MVMTVTQPKNKIEPDCRLLDYLPPVYREDKLMGQFLKIFDSILTPIENTVDNLALYFDPRLTPETLLPWLASWLDIAMDPQWPLERRRELVGKAAELYRWRGTRRGLSEYLRIYTGKRPQIIEYIPGMILDLSYSQPSAGITSTLCSAEHSNPLAGILILVSTGFL